MVLHFDIKCFQCDSTMQLDTAHIQNKTEISCPNCAQQFPKSDFEIMKTVSTSLASISEICSDSILKKGFKISIQSYVNENDIF